MEVERLEARKEFLWGGGGYVTTKDGLRQRRLDFRKSPKESTISGLDQELTLQHRYGAGVSEIINNQALSQLSG
jgi:hypothetical protein